MSGDFGQSSQMPGEMPPVRSQSPPLLPFLLPDPLPSLLTSSQSTSSQSTSSQTQSSFQPQSSTQTQQSSGSKAKEKEWQLAGGTMRVLSHGKKKSTDMYTVVQLEFTFLNDPEPRKVGEILDIVISLLLFYNILYFSPAMLRPILQNSSGYRHFKSW